MFSEIHNLQTKMHTDAHDLGNLHFSGVKNYKNSEKTRDQIHDIGSGQIKKWYPPAIIHGNFPRINHHKLYLVQVRWMEETPKWVTPVPELNRGFVL